MSLLSCLKGGLLAAACLVTGAAVAGPVTANRPGTIYRQEVPVAATGDTIVIQVFEPARLVKGRTYPLVLQSHGYGGSRSTEATGLIKRLIENGYYVISIDERGFGESSGTVRVMSPDFEGQDLVAVLDWAENLPGLRRRNNGEMLVGSFGGSYGGMYQFLLAGADPRQRLRVIAPDITPNDLTYSLNPNGVVKSGWGLALSAGAEGVGVGPFLTLLGGKLPTTVALPQARLRQDLAIYESLVFGGVTGTFQPPSLNYFKYHSVAYFCSGDEALPQDFLLATPDPRAVPPRRFPKMDALITQGFRDTLFNVNDGARNVACMKRGGGDVRFLTHQSGHILPLSIGTVPGNLEEALDPFYTALTIPGFQDAGGSRTCGSLNLDDVTFAWFEAKLMGDRKLLGSTLTTGTDVCVSLAQGDAIAVKELKRGGRRFEIADSIAQFNGPLGVMGAVLGNGAREALLANQTLYTVPAGGAILAGIPTMSIDIQSLAPPLPLDPCALPLAGINCSPTYFLAIGQRKAGTQRWDIVDDQLTPVRGFGTHTLPMTAIAERLAEGDELALLIYGFHAQYPISWSRDVSIPATTISGHVNLPLVRAREITKPQV